MRGVPRKCLFTYRSSFKIEHDDPLHFKIGMTASNSVIAGALLAALGFLTSLISSLVVATNNDVVLIIIGVFLMVLTVQRCIGSFLTKDDSKKRWTTFWTGLFCAFGGIVLFFEDDEFRARSSALTIIVLFSLTAIAVSTVLSNYYQYITRLFIPTVLESARVEASDERLLYFAVNLFSGFFIGIAVGASDPVNKLGYMDGKGLAYSVVIWFFNAIVMAMIGVKWGRSEVDIGAKYVSSGVPFAAGSNYTDVLVIQ
jgi:hypothetical protein